MKIKLIDAAWIADKALDIYASQWADSTEDRSSSIKHRTICTQNAVTKIFEETYSNAIGQFKNEHYDKIVIVVPCFPIMRVAGCSALITRFICGKTEILKSYGISSNQFLDFFEKFIQVKCEGDYTDSGNGVYWVKEKTTLLSEWNKAFINFYGSSIINSEKDGIFSENPNFISTMESESVKFTEQNPTVSYKIGVIVEKTK